MFSKILVANRGEIAVRVIRACRELGVKSVAVYSDIDEHSIHVRMADEAVRIGEAPARNSYLSIDAIIGAARKTGAEAIHPGYGFLSENPGFAERCEKEKIVFIGPSSDSMRLVGDKVASREAAAGAGIPLTPGMTGKSTDPARCVKAAKEIGFPVILKASAGGGGKGMRIIRDERELESAVEAGMREALSAFGDASVYLEKYIEKPRHVEFQILADKYGNAVHLFERECSIQRRHQKIIEESPSVIVDDDLRNRMGRTALKVVEISGYSNAGTIEFLVDENRNFYFLEVNARLQVEHPVTELVTGIDLVQAQLRIAAGEKLWLNQADLRQRGHAIECRIYAEDPENNFLPSAGRIDFMKEPSGPGIRHDCGVGSGSEVSVYYDPILSKLIAWAENRQLCCRKMAEALKNFPLIGIKTNIEFLHDIITHPAFTSGDLSTAFISQYMADWSSKRDAAVEDLALIAAAAHEMLVKDKKTIGKVAAAQPSCWETLGEWRIGGQGTR